MKLKIIYTSLLDVYNQKQRYTLHKHIDEVYKKRNSLKGLKFTLSSVYSSLIEGSNIDLDTYLFNKKTGFKNKTMQQIDDLINAYTFAQSHALNQANFIKAHAILAATFEIDKKYIGKYRADAEVSVGSIWGTVYKGCTAKDVKAEMQKLFDDIEVLKKQTLTYNQAFYFASMVHLVFVKIHPFGEGNGRAARLLEKWFLAQMLNNKVWYIPSEIHYNHHRQNYYDNLKIGANYTEVNYSKSLPFILMLPKSFSISKKLYLH